MRIARHGLLVLTVLLLAFSLTGCSWIKGLGKSSGKGDAFDVPAQVLANDDYVGSVAPTVSLLSGASTQGGTVILDNGWFVYTSPSNLASSSTDSFLYRITDSQGNTADGTVTLTAGDYSAVAVNIGSVMDANAPATGKNVTFAVVPNKLYKIYATSSLSSPITWTDLTPVGSLYPGGSNGFITINDAAAGSARFYKLEEVR